jgi:8-oxo-dGTP pyrophosphatase MutT (NUDIX family)
MSNPMLHKDFTAMALIVTAFLPRQALLLQSREHKLWMPPGGHVEHTENPVEAVIREVREETGLDITSYFPTLRRYDDSRVEIPLPFRIVEIHLTHGGKEHYHIDCMYRIEVPMALPVQHDDTESLEIGWFTLSQLNDLNIPADLLPVLRQELA